PPRNPCPHRNPVAARGPAGWSPRSAGVRVVGGLRAERLTRPTGLHQPHSSCNSHIPEPHPPPGFTRRAGRTTLVGVTERAPLSRKLSAIAESATLKVDAKA